MWQVRPYEARDREAVTALADRLLVGAPAWRDRDRWLAAARGWVDSSIGSAGEPDHALFVATDGGQVAGFASVGTQRHFAGDLDAYLGELAVARWAEGDGVARALLQAVELWARENGYDRLTLDTGAANHRARRFYGHAGFLDEGVRLTKLLGRDATGAAVPVD